MDGELWRGVAWRDSGEGFVGCSCLCPKQGLSLICLVDRKEGRSFSTYGPKPRRCAFAQQARQDRQAGTTVQRTLPLVLPMRGHLLVVGWPIVFISMACAVSPLPHVVLVCAVLWWDGVGLLIVVFWDWTKKTHCASSRVVARCSPWCYNRTRRKP